MWLYQKRKKNYPGLLWTFFSFRKAVTIWNVDSFFFLLAPSRNDSDVARIMEYVHEAYESAGTTIEIIGLEDAAAIDEAYQKEDAQQGAADVESDESAVLNQMESKSGNNLAAASVLPDDDKDIKSKEEDEISDLLKMLETNNGQRKLLNIYLNLSIYSIYTYIYYIYTCIYCTWYLKGPNRSLL